MVLWRIKMGLGRKMAFSESSFHGGQHGGGEISVTEDGSSKAPGDGPTAMIPMAPTKACLSHVRVFNMNWLRSGCETDLSFP